MRYTFDASKISDFSIYDGDIEVGPHEYPGVSIDFVDDVLDASLIKHDIFMM